MRLSIHGSRWYAIIAANQHEGAVAVIPNTRTIASWAEADDEPLGVGGWVFTTELEADIYIEMLRAKGLLAEAWVRRGNSWDVYRKKSN